MLMASNVIYWRYDDGLARLMYMRCLREAARLRRRAPREER